jgi:hypothetical protein
MALITLLTFIGQNCTAAHLTRVCASPCYCTIAAGPSPFKRPS